MEGSEKPPEPQGLACEFCGASFKTMRMLAGQRDSDALAYWRDGWDRAREWMEHSYAARTEDSQTTAMRESFGLVAKSMDLASKRISTAAERFGPTLERRMEENVKKLEREKYAAEHGGPPELPSYTEADLARIAQNLPEEPTPTPPPSGFTIIGSKRAEGQ